MGIDVSVGALSYDLAGLSRADLKLACAADNCVLPCERQRAVAVGDRIKWRARPEDPTRTKRKLVLAAAEAAQALVDTLCTRYGGEPWSETLPPPRADEAWDAASGYMGCLDPTALGDMVTGVPFSSQLTSITMSTSFLPIEFPHILCTPFRTLGSIDALSEELTEYREKVFPGASLDSLIDALQTWSPRDPRQGTVGNLLVFDEAIEVARQRHLPLSISG